LFYIYIYKREWERKFSWYSYWQAVNIAMMFASWIITLFLDSQFDQFDTFHSRIEYFNSVVCINLILVISFRRNCAAFTRKLRNVRWMKTDRWHVRYFFLFLPTLPLSLFLSFFFSSFQLDVYAPLKTGFHCLLVIFVPGDGECVCMCESCANGMSEFTCFDLRQMVKQVDIFWSFPYKINQIARLFLLDRSDLGLYLSIVLRASFVLQGIVMVRQHVIGSLIATFRKVDR